jgi:divalent metal cation (Fe/Co/Zn/Cd) transporter
MKKHSENTALFKTALWLSGFTIIYNIIEGAVSVGFGLSDDTLSLFGFGLDSFVEVISGIGVWHMVVRTMRNDSQHEAFEKTALRVTGTSFYLLAVGLLLTAVYNIYTHRRPSTTIWGIVISLVSILVMVVLLNAKLRVGKKLDSSAIIADAHCTRACIYLSIILLSTSILFELFSIGFIDAVGALGIAYYAFTEGKEAFEKAKGHTCGCGEKCDWK